MKEEVCSENNKVDIVRNIYLFGASLVGIVFFLTSIIRLVHVIISPYFPPQYYDRFEDLYLKRDLFSSLVFISLGFSSL